MTIELQESKTEALLERWMNTGHFDSVEDAIGSALEAVLSPTTGQAMLSGRTGADFFAALRRFPLRDDAPELDGIDMPVRDVEL